MARQTPPSGGNYATTSALDAVADRLVEWSAHFLGTWQVDADGARGVSTAQGGLVGGNVSYSAVANAYAVCEDGGAFKLLSASGAGYTAAYDVWPTAPANNDAFYIGSVARFCEVTNDLSVAGAYTTSALTPEYSTEAGWSVFPAGTFIDNSHLSTKDGTRCLGRTGTFQFRPPNDWAARSVNGTTAFWVRLRVSTSGNVTTSPRYNSKNPEIVSVAPANTCEVGIGGNIARIRVGSRASTLSSANDYKFVLLNWTAMSAGDRATGADYCSPVLTWTKGNRSFNIDVDLAVQAEDRLSVLMIQEDGTNEAQDVPMTFIIEPT